MLSSNRIKASGSAADPSAVLTFLEKQLPFKKLSLIATADRRAQDPVYGAHRWWARRPPGVIRGLLLAAALPDGFPESDYWRLFGSTGHPLHGKRVHDLFVGGGTTVVEAARLGALASGTDVDPLAISIVKHEITRPDPRQIQRAGDELLSFLRERVAHLFETAASKWTPLHYFYLHRVVCPKCADVASLFRNLVIARDEGKSGGVVRDARLIAFCPDCHKIHAFDDAKRKRLDCCDRYDLYDGNYAGQRYTCSACGHRSMHADLQTGRARRVLLAIEETREGYPRRIRKPVDSDLALLDNAERYLTKHLSELWLPTTPLRRDRLDARPVSFGVVSPQDFFSSRQLALFGHAFRWVRESEHPADVRSALSLSLSNALATNNKLCSYATDYGRLAPLFSVRSYSLPALAVELNPFHPNAGRGTLRRSIEKVSRSVSPAVRRYVWSPSARKPVPVTLRFRRNGKGADLRCASAERMPRDRATTDICLFDPPYFDYIAYSELSEFYRAWLDQRRLGGTPLLPTGKEPTKSYADTLSRCLKAAVRRLKRKRPLAFTFHSADPKAWEAIGAALDRAALSITALWPVRNDAHMGHHSLEANCEWDLVVVCRRKSECEMVDPGITIQGWKKAVAPMKILKGDKTSMVLALKMAKPRFGKPRRG